MDTWAQIGRHEYRIAGDLLYVRGHGDILPGESDQMCDLLLGLYQQHGTAFLIVDASGLTGMGIEARRENAAWHRAHKLTAPSVVYGANLLVRTLLTLLVSAIRLIGRHEREIRFVANEADAVRWVDERRTELRAARTAG